MLRDVLSARVEEATNHLVGQSAPMRGLFSRMRRVADAGRLTYLQGETGTGKELVAHALHDMSPRHDRPFVTVHCGAIPDQLFESELFGHTQGAFTGAGRSRRGLVREAEAGTLFLDEINSLSLRSQAKLLRFLESGEYRTVGSDVASRSKAWVIAASNEELEEQVKRGDFRADLFYRLQVLVVTLPSLRRRGQDVLLLAEHFLKQDSGSAWTFSPCAQNAMCRHDWPGNVRELRHRVENAALMAEGQVIRARDLGLEAASPADLASPESLGVKEELWEMIEGDGMTLSQATRYCEQLLIQAALEAEEGNRTRAAQRLGIHVRTIFKKLST